MNKKKMLQILLSFSILSIILIIPSVLGMEKSGELEDGGVDFEYFAYSNNTAINNKKSSETHLVVYQAKDTLEFDSENFCSVYVMNQTELGKLMQGFEFEYAYVWANTTHFAYDITYEILTENFHFYTKLVNNSEGMLEEHAYAYLVVINEVQEQTMYSLRGDYIPVIQEFLDQFSRLLIIIVFFFISGLLLNKARLEKKAEEEIKAKILTNYGLALICGAIATFSWEIYHWYRDMNPKDRWVNIFKFERMPIENFSDNYLSFVSMIMLGAAILFMSLTVEKNVQQKKIPYFTYFLITMECFLILGIFTPVILIGVIWIWIASVICAAFNIFFSYVGVAKQVEGPIRKKLIMLIVGVFLTYLAVPMRAFISPEYVMNFTAIFFMAIMYKGLVD